MGYYQDEICDEAVDAYFIWHTAQGTPESGINQPGRYDTTCDDEFVYICNSGGELARYNIATKQIEPAEDEVSEAIEAYQRYCEEHGYIYQQLAAGADVDEQYVYLHNVNGELARYNIATKQIEDPVEADEASE